MNRGTVLAVDRQKGTVHGRLASGLDILEARYTDEPPWVGDQATFTQVASNRWIVIGTQGHLNGQGPNLVPGEGDFENPGDETAWTAGGWLTKIWEFNSGLQSWAANAGAAIFWTWAYTYVPPGAVVLSASSAGDRSIHSPNGTSGVAITAGQRAYASAWTTAGDTKNVHVRLEWFNGATFLSSSSYGPTIQTSNEEWRQATVNAVAPASTTFCAMTFEGVGLGAGNTIVMDRGSITTPGTNTAVARDTTKAQTGTASLRLRSIAAGDTLMRYPGGVDLNDGRTGQNVNPGDFFYFAAWWRQDNSIFPRFVADYYDANGAYVTTDVATDATPVAVSPSTFSFHSRIVRVPAGAATARFGFNFTATAANQDLNVDDVEIRECRPVEGGVMLLGTSVGTDVGASLEDTAWMASRPTSSSNASGFPSIVAPKTHVLSRAIHAYRERSSGTQGLFNSTENIVELPDVLELTGLEAFDSPDGFRILRSGLYLVQGQFMLDDEPGIGAARIECQVQRFAADNSTFLETIAIQAHSSGAADDLGTTVNASAIRRINAQECIRLICFQLNAAASGRTLDTDVWHKALLTCTYVGEV